MWMTRDNVLGFGLFRAVLVRCATAVGLLCLAGVVSAQSPRDSRDDTRAAQPARSQDREPLEPGEADPAVASVRQPDRIDNMLRGLDPKLLNLSGSELDYEVVGDKLILRGNAPDLDLIELLVRYLESEVEQKELRIVSVTERDANDIASSVEQPLQQVFWEPNQRSEYELTVTALSSNVLLVSALPEQMDVVVGVIEQVDQTEDDLLPGKEQLVFHIKHRRASDVAEQLSEIVTKLREKQGAAGAKGEIQIIPNDANNTLLVLAPETEREKLQALLNEIDVEPVAGWGELKLTLFPLIHSEANKLADTISDLITQKKDRDAAEEMIYRLQISKALPDGQVIELPAIDLQKPTRILADEETNSLIVATVEENIVPMGELIRLLDDVPMAPDIDVKLFPLEFADAEKVAQLLSEVFDGGKQLTEEPDGSGQGGVPDTPTGEALVYPVNITPDPRSNTLIVTGRQEHLLLVTEMVAELDRRTVVQKELRVVTVTDRDAGEIASTLEPVIQNVFFEPDQRAEYEPSVSALASNIVLVAALPHQVGRIIELVEQVNLIDDELPGPEQLIFPIEYRKASVVAEQLTEILTQLREKQGASGEVLIIPNDANNTLMVLVPQSDREKVQSLLDGLDVEPVKGWGEVRLTIFPLIHSQANELSEVLTDLLESQENLEDAEEVIYRLLISHAVPGTAELEDLPPIDLQRPTRIIADEGTNSLIVATVEENVGPLGELIRLLDGVPMGEEVAVRFFPLRFADSETIGELLKQMFDEGKQLPEQPDGSGQDAVPEGEFASIVYNIGVSTDTRTNTLIVSGRPEQLGLVESVVVELDRPATALKFPLRLVPLEYTDASQIGKLITDLMEKRLEALEGTGAGKAAVERDRVFLSVDLRSNSLVISASEENYEEILSITHQLDTKPARPFDQIRIVACQRLSAKDLKEKIDELWQRKAQLRQERELLDDTPVVVVDGRSNALIIASSMEDYEEIERLVEALESQPLIDDTQLFKLEYADAAVLASMLDELFQGMAGQSEAFEAPTILPDPRSNALVIAASTDAMERAADLIKRLDVEAGPLTAVFEVYQLRHASSVQLAPRMQELFDSREDGQEITRTPIVIFADETSNSLVCSASRDDHVIIVDLLELLDSPSSIARQFEIFPLKYAKAPTVAEKLESLFQSQAEGSSGRADAIAAEADERTNSIIVWASPSQMMNIGEVVHRLDTSSPAVEMMVKVIQLKQALAEDFADLLRRTVVGEEAGSDNERAVIVSFLEQQPNGSETLRKLLRQDIKIEADPRTNSLMVMAPSDSIAMLEAMIHDFDAIRPIRSEIRLFPLVNSDAEAMVDQLTELFETDSGGDGETENQLVFGETIGPDETASVGQDLRFAADTRTNTLIAAGAEVDLRMVEELVRWLDSQEAEDRVMEVVQTKYVEPDQIASAVQGFNSQEQDVLGELDDEEARLRRMERQISVEAVGSEEEGGRSLIVGTSRRAYRETMEMIHQLDRPEPQVMISVLIAEVQLTDNFEFGMEFAGQDLNFSENAIIGPNNIIQGSDFDWVAGTQLGAAGSGLGFGYTINGEDFGFLLHALQQDSRLEVLQRPILMIRNGEEGSITIADEVPFVESSQINDTGSTNSVIGREDVGIVLTATPQISPDGYVTIALTQEISNFAGENVQLSEGVTSPIFSTREVDTNVTVRDGETVVIGGLITKRHSEGESKVPILGDLPWVGPLFRVTSASEQKVELMIAMTVDVTRTDEDVRRMSLAERDKYSESRHLHTSPLLEGLRIVPDESLMGPDKGKPREPSENEKQPVQDPDDRKLYGPKPKIYGPVISRPTQTTSVDQPVYGPKVVRRDQKQPVGE